MTMTKCQRANNSSNKYTCKQVLDHYSYSVLWDYRPYQGNMAKCAWERLQICQGRAICCSFLHISARDTRNTGKWAFENTLSAVSANAWRNKQNNCHLQKKFAPKREKQRCVFE